MMVYHGGVEMGAAQTALVREIQTLNDFKMCFVEVPISFNVYTENFHYSPWILFCGVSCE